MHIIKVCTGCSCSQNFGHDIAKKAEEILAIKVGETTKDGRFKLEKVGCMGNCSNAPNVMFCQPDGPLSAIMIDGKLQENVLPHKFAKQLKEMKENS